MKKENKWVYILAGLFMTLFAGLVMYLVYFTTVEKKRISVHPYNKRLDHLEEEIIRGDIYDSNGTLLATTKEGKRSYPLGRSYAHAVGYAQRGKYGAEALANVELLYPDYTFKSIFENAFTGKKFMGRDVVLTLDTNLQKACEEGFGKQKGAAIVLEASTGKIKAMYSNPTFDPNTLVEDWEYLVQDEEESPLVNRSTQGLYPPGSIFKILPTIGYIQKYPEDFEKETYTCEGSITKGPHTIKCFNGVAHGQVNLKQAFEKSCNAFFIHLSDKVLAKELQTLGEKLLFNAPLPFDMDYAKSRLQLSEEENDFNVLAAYMGQGKTLVTPLHMAMLSSMIVNDGVLMKPYLFDYSMSNKGNVRLKNLPTYDKAYLDEKTAQILKTYMIGVVENGTATEIARKNLKVGGKTGTAQNETSKDHSWFIGFAYLEDAPEKAVAFSVIVENGGKGAKALKVVDDILDAYVR